MVGVSGFEPPTSASQTLRAKPDCATPRQSQYNKGLRQVQIALSEVDLVAAVRAGVIITHRSTGDFSDVFYLLLGRPVATAYGAFL